MTPHIAPLRTRRRYFRQIAPNLYARTFYGRAAAWSILAGICWLLAGYLQDKLPAVGLAILPTGLALYLPTRVAIDRKKKLLIVDRFLGLMRGRFPFNALVVYESAPSRHVSSRLGRRGFGRPPSRAFIVAVNRPTRTEVYAGARMRGGLAARLKIELKRIQGKDIPVLYESEEW